MLGDFAQHLGRHILVRQLLKHLLSALADIAAACEHEGQRTDGLWHRAQGYLVAGVADRLARHTRVAVVVCWANMLGTGNSEFV